MKTKYCSIKAVWPSWNVHCKNEIVILTKKICSGNESQMTNEVNVKLTKSQIVITNLNFVILTYIIMLLLHISFVRSSLYHHSVHC